MKKKFSITDIFLVFFTAMVLLAPFQSLHAQETQRFVSVIDDLPLIDGLIEDPGSATVFETAEGRIVEVFASGVLEQDQLLVFYDKTLPQLGWLRIKRGLFHREGEILSLEFSKKLKVRPESVSVLTVGFRIKPSINNND
jgi:hypothetical protein